MKNLINAEKLKKFVFDSAIFYNDEASKEDYLEGAIDLMRFEQRNIVKSRIDTLILLKDKMTKQMLENPNSENTTDAEILVKLQNNFTEAYNELIGML